MKQSMSSTVTIQVIIFFILIFAAFLSLVIQYSKAYRVKNEVLMILEKYEGYTSTSSDIIDNYLWNQSYKTTGSCSNEDGENTWYGINGTDFEVARTGEKYSFCIQENKVVKKNKRGDVKSTVYYYNVIFFYKFNLPIVGELNTFRVTGKTKSFVGADEVNKLLS